MEHLISRVETTLEKHPMVRRGDRILVACSGGPDSVALFHVLRMLEPRYSLKLGLLHFDHALRPGSAADLKFVRDLAASFRVPFYGERRKGDLARLGKNLSPEEAARNARYDFFERTARKSRFKKVALAHQRDDQAETLLMRVIQGTGLRGLQGIRPVVRKGGLVFIRPLLEIGREEILPFLKKNRFRFRIDPTNRSTRFLRNRLRRRLLPLMEREFNPRVREALSRLAETAYAESRGMDEWTEKHWKQYVARKKNGSLHLRRKLLELPGALQFRLLERVLRSMDPASGLDFKAWRRIQAGFQKGRLRTALPRALDLCLMAKRFFIRKNDTIQKS